MQRDEWFSELCRRVLDWVAPGPAGSFVRCLGDLDTSASTSRCRDLGPALAIVEVARRYSRGHHPDEIVEWLASEFAAPIPDALEAVVNICETFRRQPLPGPSFWFPDQLRHILLGWYLRLRIQERGVEAASAELQARWQVHPLLLDPIVEQATSELPAPADWLTGRHMDRGARVLQLLATRPDVRDLASESLATYPDQLWERDDLVAVARERETLVAILDAVQIPESFLDAVIDERFAAYRRTFDLLSPYEQNLLRPQRSIDRLLEKMMSHVWDRRAYAPTGVNALPDRVSGSWQLPPWLLQYVYSSGGRIRRSSVGPMAHWLIVADSLADAARLAMLLEHNFRYQLGVRHSEELVSWDLVLPDIPSDPMHIEFVYSVASAEALIDLVVLLATKVARLDIFGLNGDRRLVGLGTVRVRLPEDEADLLLEDIAPAMERFVETFEGGWRHIFLDSGPLGQALEVDAFGIFDAAERAKSEELSAAIDPRHLLAGAKATQTALGAVREAREDLVDAHVEAAQRRHAGAPDSDDDTVLEAMVAYSDAVAHMRGTARKGTTMTPREAVAASTAGLVGRRSAVVHLAITPGATSGFDDRLDMAWVTGAAGSLEADYATHDELDLRPLVRAAREPLRSPDDFDAMIAAAPALGSMVAGPLAESGVRRVTVCPTSFLHAVPLHCWPLEEGGETLVVDAVERFSYAPSCAVLQRLRRTRRPRGSQVMTIGHEADLRYARIEARLLSLLADGSGAGGVGRGDLANTTEAGVLHVSCHGKWFLDDYWRSGLAVASGDGSTRWLTVGEIQRDLDLGRTEVVGLLACESGVSTAETERVDEYSGIDGAVMAAGARVVISTLWRVADPAAFIFAATFYLGLSEGVVVYRAYNRAIEVLRTGEYREIDGSTAIGALIAEAGVDWPAEVRMLDAHGIDLRHPFFWGVFKLSGIAEQPVAALTRKSRVAD